MENEINEYLKKHAVWCPTLQEAEEFMEFVKNKIGLKTVSNGAYKFWKNYEEKTAFANVFNKVGYSPYEWYLTEQGLSIVPFKDFKSKFMEETMNLEKEAQKCCEEGWKEEVREIVREEVRILFEPKDASEVRFDKPLLTNEERNILKGLHLLGWKWIARDEDGDLNVYEQKPQKKMVDIGFKGKSGKWVNSKIGSKIIDINRIAGPLYNKDNFQFVKWWNEEPTLIADLIEDE